MDDVVWLDFARRTNRGGHYDLGELTSLDDVRELFADPGKANPELNWLFLATSGVHGTYSTLDDIEAWFAGDRDAYDDDWTPHLTVLVVWPRIVRVVYGHVPVEAPDLPWLRAAVARSSDGVARSQAGNLPK